MMHLILECVRNYTVLTDVKNYHAFNHTLSVQYYTILTDIQISM